MWRMALMPRLFSAHIFPQNTNFLLSLSSKGSFCKRFSRTFLIFLRPLNFSLLLYHLLWLVQRVGIFFSSPLFTGRLRWVLHIPDSSSRGPSSLCLPQSTWLKKYLYSPLVPSTTASPAARCHEGRDFGRFLATPCITAGIPGTRSVPSTQEALGVCAWVKQPALSTFTCVRKSCSLVKTCNFWHGEIALERTSLNSLCHATEKLGKQKQDRYLNIFLYMFMSQSKGRVFLWPTG